MEMGWNAAGDIAANRRADSAGAMRLDGQPSLLESLATTA
jgi:hypothetical protein